MSVIKIKRSSSTGSPPSLAQGEISYSYLQDNTLNGGDRLYIGTGTEVNGEAANIEVIGGKYFTSKLSHTPGILTANSAIITDNGNKINELHIDNITINGNEVKSTNVNGDITIKSNGAGDVILSAQNVVTSANLNVTNVSSAAYFKPLNLTAGRIPYIGMSNGNSGVLKDDSDLTFNGTTFDIGDGAFTVDTSGNVLITGNTTNTGSTNLGNISISGDTITSTLTNGDVLLDPTGEGKVKVVGTNSLVLPAGTQAQRNAGENGSVRLNTSISQFEGYANGHWISLGGVRSVDGLTYIAAEESNGNSDDKLHFYAATGETTNTKVMEIDATTVRVLANTESSNTSTGSLSTAGGIAAKKNLNIGGDTILEGSLETGGNVIVGGNLTVNGNTTTVNVDTLDVSDSLIRLAYENTSDSVDIGFVGTFNDGTDDLYSGFFRDSTTKEWFIFQDYQDNNLIDNIVDVSSNTFSRGILNVNHLNTSNTTITLSGDVSGSVTIDQWGGTNYNVVTSVQPNSVTLGTDTTGNYVSTVTANNATGVSISGAGEGANVVVSGISASTSGQIGVATYDSTNFDITASKVSIIEIDGGTY